MTNSKSQPLNLKRSLRLRHLDLFVIRHFLGACGCLLLCLPSSALSDDSLTLSWTNNLLTISNSNLPGGKLDIWYLEAFCRKGSTHRDWGKTVLPHKTVLTSASSGRLQFRTQVEPDVEVFHSVSVLKDVMEFV